MKIFDFWKMPVLMMLSIYLPASLAGLYLFRDIYSISFIYMLGIFVLCYYVFYICFSIWMPTKSFQEFFYKIGDRISWPRLALVAILTYLATIIIASFTVDSTPLATALNGGNWLDIAKARANFLANRDGVESLLRYIALILGRAVLPYLLIYAYYYKHKQRHYFLILMLFCYLISLEKASCIFLFLPLIILSLTKNLKKLAFFQFICLIFFIGLWTFLAHGGLANSEDSINTSNEQLVQNETTLLVGGAHGDPDRFSLFVLVNRELRKAHLKEIPDVQNVFSEGLFIVNRSIWIPYITAYDWLKFQDEILDSKLTYGGSIMPLSWILNKPLLNLEQMVYEYEFGPPPGGLGGSNTVFFVDAKIAFGWIGVFIYNILFTAFAYIIFTSKNEIAKIASFTTFFTACLSSLTATLLSGGLFFYIMASLLIRPQAANK